MSEPETKVTKCAACGYTDRGATKFFKLVVHATVHMRSQNENEYAPEAKDYPVILVCPQCGTLKAESCLVGAVK